LAIFGTDDVFRKTTCIENRQSSLGSISTTAAIYWKCYDFLQIHSIRNQISIDRGGGYISVKEELV